MTELVHMPLRVFGVVLPGTAVLGLDELRGQPQEDGFGLFLGAMALSLLAAGMWSARDARVTGAARVLVRWAVVTIVVGAGIGVVGTLVAPGSPPEERTSEMVSLSLFFAVPLLVVVGLGLLAGLSDRRQEKSPT